MNRFEALLRKGYILASVYLFSLFAIFGLLLSDEHSPNWLDLFLKITIGLAILIIIGWSIGYLYISLKNRIGKLPLVTAALFQLSGYFYAAIWMLIQIGRSCGKLPNGSMASCSVSGRTFFAVTIVIPFLMSLIGLGIGAILESKLEKDSK